MLQPEGGQAPHNQRYRIPSASIAMDYLDVMGIELVAGRAFESADVNAGAVIIDRDLARFLWPGSALGQRFRVGDDGPWLTVVGVGSWGEIRGKVPIRFSILRPLTAWADGPRWPFGPWAIRARSWA